MKITYEQIDTIISYADGIHRVMRETGLDEEEIAEMLLDTNVEKCPSCGWYCESGEMCDSEGEIDGHCANCRTYKDEGD